MNQNKNKAPLLNKSWTLLLRDSLKNQRDLENFFQVPFPKVNFPLFIPLPLAFKIKKNGLDSPLGKQFLPSEKENDPKGLIDPIGDTNFHKTGPIIHRYHQRALWLTTTICPTICRFCFRKNELYEDGALVKLSTQQKIGIEYLKDHPEIEELIFTGGDPLMLENSKLDRLLEEISKVASLKYIRFHTKMLSVLPQRFDEDFFQLIKKYKKKFLQLSFAFHINHELEWSTDHKIDLSVQKILNKLKKMNLNLLTQTVLLKDINDSPQALISLMHFFIKAGVRPYYLHHPDQVLGGLHFGLTLKEGREIYQSLKDALPGWAIPHYVLDLPEGKGKVLAYNSEKIDFSGLFLDRFGHSHAYDNKVFLE